MSDFKVGDVVQLRPRQRDATMEPWMDYGQRLEVVPSADADYLYLSPEGLERPVSGGWDPRRFSLVSRPSEAKPALKPGDRVITKHGLYGILRGDSDVPGFRWQVEIYDHNGPDGFATNLREHEVMPAPALKVGDRVRVLAGHDEWSGVTGIIFEIRPNRICRIHNDAAYASVADPLDGPGVCQFFPDSLELLPPEPASNKGLTNAAIADAERVIRGADLAGRYRQEIMGTWPDPKPPRPMTATEASIRARNEVVPFFDPPPKEIQEYHAKWMNELMGAMSLPKELLGKWPEPPKPDNQGWMPAGTYMPLNEADAELKALNRRLGVARWVEDNFPDKPNAENLAAGIATKLPAYSRRLPSRTTQWSNAGDDYDLLEDA